jgi:hypothetical protein
MSSASVFMSCGRNFDAWAILDSGIREKVSKKKRMAIFPANPPFFSKRQVNASGLSEL